MAWVTAIRDDEQVAYRLREDAGCRVPDIDGQEPESAQTRGEQGDVDDPVAYRMRPEGDGILVWMGAGLEEVGLAAGRPLDEDGKEAARLLMAGCHPATGARLVPAELRAHPASKLPGARLLEALEAAAEDRGLDDAAGLLEGKPKQQAALRTLRRMVCRFGEAHRLQVDTLHRLARAAGLDLAHIYEPAELADARAHQNDRISIRVRGWDLTADLDKSTSVAFALLDPHRAKTFRELFHQAKREAFTQLEDWIGYAVTSEDGELVRIATGGLMGWSVEHQSARPVDDTPGDPHLHAHIVVANLARCVDGKWRSVANSGQDLHRHAKAFDALFKARIRALAYERFGMRYEPDPRTGAWEVVGIPEQIRAAFSRRGAAVDQLVGADASREDKHRASQETRHAKHDQAGADVRASWRQRADDLVDVEAMMADAVPGPSWPDGAGIDGPGGGPRIPSPGELARAVFDPERGLTGSEKEFSRAQLLASVAHALPHGIGSEQGALDRLVDQVLAVDGYAVPLPARGSRVMSSTARYTTADILAAEQTITTHARARYDAGAAQLGVDQAATAISVFEVAMGFELSAEQRQVVERILTAGHGIDAIIGVAGSGKTTLMQACRLAWDATGTTYAGAALTAVAAAGLEAGSGIPSRTLASWLQRITDGPGLEGVDVLVLDEAAMTDDRSVAALLIEAARTGTKVVAIGDPQQLQAIGPGGGFAEIHRIVGGAILSENRRQKNAGERAALEVWRTGARKEALRLLADAGRVHAVQSADQAHTAILAAWDAARSRWADPHEMLAELVVLAARNADVDRLNTGAQALRRSAGELGTEHTYALPGDHRLTLAVGDVVRVRVNEYRSRQGRGPDLLNGYRALVDRLDAQHRVHITWRTPAGEHEGAWLTADQIAGGALSLGYAMTIAASQGLTATTTLTYGHGADAYALYPGITRAREANHLWLPAALLEDDDTRAMLGEARTESELLQRAIAAYARLLHQDRPDAMVSDQLRPAPEPAAPAPVPEQEHEEAAPRREPAPVQPWRERQLGHLRGNLLAAADKAEQQATARLAAAEDADHRAARMAALLDTDQQPARLQIAETAARLDAAEQHLARADHLDQQHTAISTQITTMYETNRTELAIEGRIRARAALTRSVLLGTRWGLQRDADVLHHRIQERTDRIEQLRRHAHDLHAAATGHRDQARDLITAGRSHASHQPLDAQLAERRVELPALAQQLDAHDRREHQRVVGQAVTARTRAAELTDHAAGLRAEHTLRTSLTPEQAITEVAERAHAARLAAQQRHLDAEHEQQARIDRDRAYHYQPPAPQPRGPSLGM